MISETDWSGSDPPIMYQRRMCCVLFPCSVCLLCAQCVFPGCHSYVCMCSVCLLCAVRSGYYWVRAVCVCWALCAVFGSFFKSQLVLRSPAPALPSFHTETLSPDAYTQHFALPFRPFSCTPGLIIQCPSHPRFITFMETPTCLIELHPGLEIWNRVPDRVGGG